MLRSLRLSFFSPSAKTSIFAPSCSTFAPSLAPRSRFVKDSLRRQYHGSDPPASNNQPWRSEDIMLLLSLHQQGKPLREIAVTLQRTYVAVRDKLDLVHRTDNALLTRARRVWTDQEDNQLKSLMRDKVEERDIKAIAVMLGRSRSSIKNRLERLRREAGLSKGSVPLSRKNWTGEQLNRAKALREEGKSIGDISKTLGRTEGSVANRLRYEELTGKPFNPDHFFRDQDIEEMRLLRAQGKSFNEIQRIMFNQQRTARIARATIVRITRGVRDRPTRSAPSRWSASEIDTLRDLTEKGLSPKEISEHLPGRSPAACNNAMTTKTGLRLSRMKRK